MRSAVGFPFLELSFSLMRSGSRYRTYKDRFYSLEGAGVFPGADCAGPCTGAGVIGTGLGRDPTPVGVIGTDWMPRPSLPLPTGVIAAGLCPSVKGVIAAGLTAFPKSPVTTF